MVQFVSVTGLKTLIMPSFNTDGKFFLDTFSFKKEYQVPGFAGSW